MSPFGKLASVPVISVDESAAVRDRLLGGIAALQAEDAATSWAYEAVPSKNKLTTADAKQVEDAFEQKVAGFLLAETAAPVNSDISSFSIPGSQEVVASDRNDPRQPNGIDKSMLAVSTPRRFRNKEHLRYVSQQPCLLCTRQPSDAHHLRFVQPRALGRKSSDEFAVPLCRTHHRAAHRAGDERNWWRSTGIDPVKVARKLWKDTRLGKPCDPVQLAVHEPSTIQMSAIDSKAP